MGLCPQHDLLWETLTAREHLSFYGRLKGLEGVPLKQAVDKALKDVNLYEVGDKEAGQYSGGMKRRSSVTTVRLSIPLGPLCMRLARLSILYSAGMTRRLSVAISLIGDPKVTRCFATNTCDPSSQL
jgi:hypothetical protein